MDERATVEAVTGGDREAFRWIVEQESATVFRICYRILGRVHEAEDVTQEAFVMAFRSLGSFRGDGPLGAWLARIATRQALRRASQRSEVLSIDAVPDDRGPVGGPDPLGTALAAERQVRVRAAVTGLAEPYREIVALRFFGELSLAEIAAATDRPVPTVKT
ncbi:MAG: RNA polymerase sigma factor, partial [Candidatus Limnocylindrales bacterium]